MKIKSLFTIVVLILFIQGCSGIKPVTGTEPECRKIRLKVKVRGKKERYSTTMVVKYRKENMKVFFLGGVVKQVFMKLLVKGEKAVLLNNRKGKYWIGHFTTLTERMWGVSVQSDEFVRLIEKGEIPKKASDRIEVRFSGEFPEKFVIKDRDRVINIKNGKVDMSRDDFTLMVKKHKRVTLSEVFNND